jgi:hypothetical protein
VGVYPLRGKSKKVFGGNQMSSYYTNVLAYETSQNTVMAAAIIFSLSVIAGWFLLPVLIPKEIQRVVRIIYIVLCAALYLFMAVWFAMGVLAK